MDSAPSVRALLIAEAAAHEHRGDRAGACRAYLAAGDSENAARVLGQLGRWRDAGHVLLRGIGWTRGKTNELEESQRAVGQRAAEHLARGGEIKEAAEILVALGRRGRAVELLRVAGAHTEAARLEAEGGGAVPAVVNPARGEGSGPSPNRSATAMRAVAPIAVERSAGVSEESGTSYRMRRTATKEIPAEVASEPSAPPGVASSPPSLAAPGVALDLLPDLEFSEEFVASVTQGRARALDSSALGSAPGGAPSASPVQRPAGAAAPSAAAPAGAAPPVAGSGAAHAAQASPPASATSEASSAAAEDPAILALQQGSRVAGRYRLGRLIGRGGFSAVFEATDTELDEAVAIKILASAASDGEIMQRFKQEVAVARRVAHPNVIRLFDFGRAGPHAFITMELLEGEDLGAMLQRGRLPLQEGLGLFVQVCDSLQALHATGVVHRDIKPENFFVERSGVVKIMDFGMAKWVDARKGITISAKLAGTPQYMAPEQVNNFTGVTHLADLYALGCILYRAFTGVLPFDSAEIVPLLVMHVMDPPKPPRTRNADIPPELEQMILKLLEKRPEKRPASAHEVSVDLAGIRMRYR
jgi:hypothetical protein